MNTVLEIKFTNQPAEKGKTKFGGQPDWLLTPEWPISREVEKPMRFICQIALHEIYPEQKESYAYLFMSDFEDKYVGDTWDPHSGENALIIQPGNNEINTVALTSGPSLYHMAEKEGEKLLVETPYDSKVELVEIADPELIGEEIEIVNKIGGKPTFIQDDEYPSEEKWDLLIQLDSMNVPFFVNFGDAGVGYGFISEDRQKAKFLWQCS
ncbi:MAG: DUF1963 domain-containing protein [Bacteroidota bacterium]